MNEAMQKLCDGFQQFRQGYFVDDNPLQQLLATRQQPQVLVIACCDSRVDPAIILNADPGDLFIIRNVSNIIPPYLGENEALPKADHHGVTSAIEFAIRYLNIPNILILGHADCGGIEALLNNQFDDTSYISSWVSILSPAKEVAQRSTEDPVECQHICELEGIKCSRQHLLAYPWILNKVQAGQLMIHGWHYDFKTGALLGLDGESGKFSTML